MKEGSRIATKIRKRSKWYRQKENQKSRGRISWLKIIGEGLGVTIGSSLPRAQSARDNFVVLLRTGSERFGLIELSWLSNETDIVYELSDFTGKRLQIHRDFDYMVDKNEEPTFTVSDAARNFFVEEGRILRKWTRLGMSYFRGRRALPVVNLINTYLNCIKNDLPPPVTPEDGRNNIKLLESIEKSLDEKHAVRITLV